MYMPNKPLYTLHVAQTVVDFFYFLLVPIRKVRIQQISRVNLTGTTTYAMQSTAAAALLATTKQISSWCFTMPSKYCSCNKTVRESCKLPTCESSVALLCLLCESSVLGELCVSSLGMEPVVSDFTPFFSPFSFIGCYKGEEIWLKLVQMWLAALQYSSAMAKE